MKNRLSRIFSLLTAILFLSFSLAGAGEGPASDAEKNFPIKVNGDSVEYFHETEKVIGTGHVRIDYSGAELSADKITLYMTTKIAIAEGHVTLKQKGSTYTGEYAEYDFGKGVGKVDKMTAFIEPALRGKAQSVTKISDSHYRAQNAYVTTCCGDNPFYRVQASEIDVYPGDKVVARNALFLVKGVPLFFIPIFVQPLYNFERFPVQFVPGKTHEWGPFLLSKWRYDLANTPDAQWKGNLLFDWREKRGFAGGDENFYRIDRFGRGTLKFYYADDKEPPVDAQNDRYRAQWRHQTKLTSSTAITTEINKLSDATIIKDFFFHEEYERDVFPDNYVSIITAKPEFTTSILVRERLDDFFTVVERSPEVRFDTHARRLADTPVYLRQEYQFDNLKKEFANSAAEQDLVRFDTNQTVYYAGRVGDFSVTPRIGTRQTFFTRRNEDGESQGRGTFDPGLDVSTRFFKTYDVKIKRFGLDYNGVRHIFRPSASYNYRPNPTVSRTVLGQFDFLDAIDKQHFIRFAFENKLQTKHHIKPKKGTGRSDLIETREIARIIPFFDMDYDTHFLENIGMDVELRPYTWLGLEGNVSYDAHEHEVPSADFDLYVNKGPFEIGIGERYLRHESSLLTAQLRWKIDAAHSLKVYERFEFEDNDSEEFEITLSKVFDCVIVDFTYNHRQGETFFFVLRLKDYPRASFSLSQSYNRPKTSPRHAESGGFFS